MMNRLYCGGGRLFVVREAFALPVRIVKEGNAAARWDDLLDASIAIVSRYVCWLFVGTVLCDFGLVHARRSPWRTGVH